MTDILNDDPATEPVMKQTFVISAENPLVKGLMWVCKHGLETDDIMVTVRDAQGRRVQRGENVAQHEDVIVFTGEFREGDRIIVFG